MPYEIDDQGLRVIGYGVPLSFYDPNRVLRAQIYLQPDGTLNLGGIYGSAGPPAESVGRHALGNTAIHMGAISDGQAPQFLKADGSRSLVGNLSVADGATIDGVDISAHAGDTDIHVAHSGVSITAGNGLTGGGAITASRTIAVGAGSGITVNASDVALAWGTPTIGTIQPDATANAGTSENPARSDHRHAIVAAAPSTLNPDQSNAEGTATSFARSDHIHNVPAASAVTLSVASTNAEGNSTSFARANHTHAITTSANPGAAASILASSAAGHLTLVQVNADTIADRSGGNIAIAPAGDIQLNPTGAQVRTMSGVQIQSDHYASQVTGWGVSYDGAGDFRYLYTDELHAKAFIADLEQALAGGQIISKSVAILSRNFTAPSAGGSATLYVWDLPSAEDMAVFQSGDIVRIREFSRAGGSLSITNCWGVVTNYTDRANKEQSWTFTRSTGGNAGAMTGGTVIGADAIILDYGTSGNGFYEVNAIDGMYAINSPYAQTVTWTTHPATGQVVRTRLGNLRGITAQTEHGLYAGEGVATGDSHILLSDQTLEIHDIPMAFYDSGDAQRIGIEPDAGSADKLFWAGPSAADPRFVVYGDGSAWMSNLALSPTLADQFFSRSAGLLLLNSDAPLTPTSWTSLRGQTATISGAFHTVAGPWAGSRALMLEMAATNLDTNPVFRNWSGSIPAGWSTVNSPYTAQATDWVLYDLYSVEIGNASTTADRGIYRDYSGLAPGTNVTVTVYVRKRDYGLARLMVWDGGGFSNVVISSTGALGVHRLAVTKTVPGSGSIRIALIATTAGMSSRWDAVQVEASGYATTFLYGDMGSGYAWTSTAHASTSTRGASWASFDTRGRISPVQGSMVINFQLGWDTDQTGLPTTRGLFTWWDAFNTESLYIALSAASVSVVSYAGSSSQSLSAYSLDPGSAGDWHELVLTWSASANELKLYVDGALVRAGTWTAPTIASTMAYLGYVTAHGAGSISQFATLGAVLTPEQVAALYHRNAPLADAGAFDTPGVYILDGRFRLATSTSGARTEIDPTGWWGYGADADEAFAFSLVDGVNFGGKGLDQGDVFIGNYDDDQYLYWDASAGTLEIAGNITALGGSFSGVLSIGASGGIYQGTGSFATPTTGLKIWNDSGVGRIAGYNDGTVQWYASTDGKLRAGGGLVSLDAGGITIAAKTSGVSYSSDRAYAFDVSGTRIGGVFGTRYDSYNAVRINVPYETGYIGVIALDADIMDFTTSTVSMVFRDSYIGIGGGGLNVGSTSDPGDNNLSVAGTATIANKVYINDTSNAKQTTGLTINQGAADDEILALKSSDVAHGMTDLAETDTYGAFAKSNGNAGGLQIFGYRDADGDPGRALSLVGRLGEAADTAKSTSATAVVALFAQVKSGTNVTSVGANGNLVTIHNHGTTRFIFDAEGDAHADVSWATFDDYDDIALLADLERAMLAQHDPVKAEFVDFLQYNHAALEDAGLVHFDHDNPGHAMVNTTKLSMALVGALRQINGRIEHLEKAITG